MPGKSGPELSKELRGSVDNYILRGSYPLPKPATSGPRRSSVSGPVTKEYTKEVNDKNLNQKQSAKEVSNKTVTKSSLSKKSKPKLALDLKRTKSVTFDQKTSSKSPLRHSAPATVSFSNASISNKPPPPPLTPVPSHAPKKGQDGDLLTGIGLLRLIEEQEQQSVFGEIEEDSAPRKPIPVPTYSYRLPARQGLFDSVERLQLIEDQEGPEEESKDPEDKSVLEESVEFHKSRNIFERLTSLDGPGNKSGELGNSLSVKQLCAGDQGERDIQGSAESKVIQGQYVSHVREHFGAGDMDASFEELRSLAKTADKGRPPPLPGRESNSTFSTIGSRNASNLHMRSTLKASTSSLPGSRGASPNPDSILSTGRRSTMGADMRHLIVEKEVTDSQLRKLQVENSSLQTENKLLKEKYNRAQSRISSLETQLLSAQSGTDSLGDDMSAYMKRSREHSELDRQSLEEKVVQLTRQVATLQAEKAELESELARARSGGSMALHIDDRSTLIRSFRTQLDAMNDEVHKIKLLNEQAERDRLAETNKLKDTSAKVVKLTELKTLLQQQADNAGGGVAEKQVKSLEKRLKITEDRLCQERSDRANKLSQVEEKLLNENAQLQVTEKELKRQLHREKDKNKTLDNKYKDCREENDRLRVIVSSKPALKNTPSHEKWSSLRDNLSTKQLNEDMEHIRERLSHDDDLDLDKNSEQCIWLLWKRQEQSSQRQKEIDVVLESMNINPDSKNVVHNLKQLRADYESREEKMEHFRHLLEDSKHERDQMQSTLAHEIQTLIRDKHGAHARVQTLEDKVAALSVERDSLQTSLQSAGVSRSSVLDTTRKTEASRTAEAQVVSLSSELSAVRADLAQQTRHVRLLEAESESMRIQLRAKQAALDEALDEWLRGDRAQGGAREQLEHQTARLNAQVKANEEEVTLWRDKYNNAVHERATLEDDVTRLRKQVSMASFTPDGRVIDPVTESEKLSLESEVREKDQSLMSLTVRYNEAENALQRGKHASLDKEQEHEIIQAQMDQLELQLKQKARVIEQLNSDEQQHMVETAAVTQNLEDCNKQLSQLQKEHKTTTIESKNSRAHVEQLQQDVEKRDRLLSARLHEIRLENAPAEDLPVLEQLHQTETNARMLQTQVGSLKHQISRDDTAMEELVDENTQLLSQLRVSQQQLVGERAQLCQLTSETVELGQKLQFAEEEKAYWSREKNQLEMALAKQEDLCEQVTEQLQEQVNQNPTDIDSVYAQLDPSGKKIAIELGTCRKLLDARDKELKLLKDSNNRQKQEAVVAKHKAHMVEERNQAKQKEVEQLTQQLNNQTQEAPIVAETSQSLASERAKFQLEKLQRDRDLHKEQETLQLKTLELSSLQNKLERSDEKLRSTENLLHNKETKLVALETELHHQNKALTQVEQDKAELKSELTQYQEELRTVTGLNSTLEQRLSLEKSSLSKEKTDINYLKEELIDTSQQLEALRQDFEIVSRNLEAEKRAVQNLKDKCQEEEAEIASLQQQEQHNEAEIERLQQHLKDNQLLVETNVQEKQSLKQAVENLAELMKDKEAAITNLQHSNEACIEAVRQDSQVEKAQLLAQIQHLKDEVEQYRSKVEDVTDQLRKKEMQLETYVQTNKNLEGDVKVKYGLENEVSRLETELNETKRVLTRLEGEHARLTEQNKHLQESLDNMKETNAELRAELRDSKESHSQESSELRKELQEEKHKHELERVELQERFNKTSAELKASEASLTATQEAKELLTSSQKSTQRSVDELKSQVHEENTARKLAEQRVESLLSQLEDVRLDKTGYDEKSSELQSRLNCVENELCAEKENSKQLQHELEMAKLRVDNLGVHTQNLAPQLEEARVENTSLRGQLDTLRQELTGKNKRLALEMKQQVENYDRDRSKLVAQAEQLAADLDAAREAAAAKNRENLQLQEQLLSQEGNLRESSRDVKQLKESLTLEEQTRDKLDKRNMELELLMTKMRSKDTDNINFEANRNEVQKMISELRMKMQSQLDNQKGTDSEVLAKERKRAEDLKKRLSTVESQMSQEQALHIVSKTRLQSLDDENQRLRTQNASLRRRLATASHSDGDRNKSRIEEINEIIAKSQSRARQMLAAGNYNPVDNDPLKINSAFNPLQLDLSAQANLPNSHYWRMTSSPRHASDADRSMGSEDFSLGIVNGHKC